MQDLTLLPGVDRSGTTDSTVALAAFFSTGGVGYIPSGANIRFTRFTMAGGGIVGDGLGNSILTSVDNSTSDVITYVGNSAPILRDFSLVGAASKVAGAGFNLAGPGGTSITGTRIDGIQIKGFPIAMHFTNAYGWMATASHFTGTQICMLVENRAQPDSGDSTVSGCYFGGTLGTTLGIAQYSSGGLKIIGNKFIGGLTGYLLHYGSGPTGQLIIAENSMEDISGHLILLQQQSGFKELFGAVAIHDNFLGGVNAGMAGIYCQPGQTMLTDLSIQGNRVFVQAGGTGIHLDYVARG